MREVQRLDDDVVLFWRALPVGMTLQEWRRLDPTKVNRDRQAQYAKTRISTHDINNAKALALAQPPPLSGYTWWLYARGEGARQFTTTSGDLEPDDAWVGETEVMYRDGNNELTEASKADVIVTRDARGGVTKVERKQP